mgnify:CR=1 FL=1
MLIFYIKHYIDTHRVHLGILKALGYSDIKIAKHFWVFGLSVLVGAVAGYGLAFAIMPVFYSVQNADGLIPSVTLRAETDKNSVVNASIKPISITITTIIVPE